MKDTEKTENVTRDPSVAAHIGDLCAEFKAAWQAALKGGAQPPMESYLGRVVDKERLKLRRELERIQRDFEPRLAQPGIAHGGATIDFAAAAGKAGTALASADGTIDSAPQGDASR